jgi:hypothetical protein
MKPEQISDTFSEMIDGEPIHLRPVLLESLIFWASILRAQRNMPASNALLAFVEQRTSELDPADRRTVVARLSQEQGLNAYAAGDFSTALELFSVQGRLANTMMDRALGRVNSLLCYEFLGLPLTDSFRRAKDAVAECRSAQRDDVSSLENVLYEFELRLAFGRGDLAALLDNGPPKTRYAAFMKAWMCQLPWHMKFHDEAQIAKLIEAMAPDAGYLYLQDYRLRTLQGISLPQDIQVMPAHELATRAYVWTWRWLLDPARFDVQRILDTLASPVFGDGFTGLAPAHVQMLRNVAHWIGLFSSENALRFERWSRSLPTANVDTCVVFNWENLMIRYIEAKHRGQHLALTDIAKVMRSLPTQAHNDVLFTAIFEGLENSSSMEALIKRAPWLKTFLINLSSDASTLAGSPSSGGSSTVFGAGSSEVAQSLSEKPVVVDLISSEVKTPQGQQTSRGITLGLALLKSRGQVSRADFAATVWGIQDYQPGMHDTKILNLLARMRQIVGPGIRLGVKDHMVFSHGRWDHIRVVGSFHHVAEIGQAKIALRTSRQLVEPSRPDSSTIRRARALLEDYSARHQSRTVTRRDIEFVLDLPRSSANRLIDRLIKYQVLLPQGQGVKRHYQIRSKWESEL